MKRIPGLFIALLLAACQSPQAQADNQTLSAHSLEHGGIERSYQVFVPPQHRNNLRGLIVALHGGLGTGDIMAQQSGLNAAAIQHGFAVAYPDGIGRGWNAGSCCGGPMERKVDDVGFIKALVDAERQRLQLSATQVFGTGFSNGAMLLHRISCEAPDTFHAIAPVSGGPMFADCAKPEAMAVLMIQGRLDKRIPWDGGVFDGTRRPAMAEIVQQYARRNGCSDTTEVLRQADGITCWQRSGCGAPVQWCGLDKVGHQWPGGRTYLPRVLGANTQRYSASESIALFFRAQLEK